MKRALLALLLCGVGFLYGQEEEGKAVKRIYDHLLIKDVSSAVIEGKKGVISFPDSKSLHLAYFQALCQKGEETEAFEEFSWLFQGKEESFDRSAFEWLAWSVLDKGEKSSLLMIRLYALLGAAFTRDAKALPVLLKELRGTNALLRSLAVKLSAQYGDAPLREELVRLLKEERVWFVRLEVIRAVGQLKIQQTRDYLQKIIESPRVQAEEKAEAMIALASMYERLTQEELVALVASNRAGLRHLASEIVAHLDLQEGVDSLAPLLFDASPDVRISVMNTLGLLRVKRIQGKDLVPLLQKNLHDVHPGVSITAAWLCVLLGSDEGRQRLDQWMRQEKVEAKRLASSAIAALGPYGVKMALDSLKRESDSYVRVNLAMGLIGQRKDVKAASEVLFRALQQSKEELWMWDSSYNPLFRSLCPSEVHHIEQIPRYPDVVDQLVKLDILSMLTIAGDPRALEVIKEFLKARSWAVTGAAAVTLLQEGDEISLDLVRDLLNDEDEKIQVQAALILAVMGRDPSAMQVLTKAYPKVDRDLKIHILEALGSIGDIEAVPFLIERLKEPFQGIRVVAACALIQCLS